MILDLPPETVQAIVAKAELQGISPQALLANQFLDKPPFEYPDGYSETEFNAIFDEIEKYGLNSDGANMVLTEQDAKTIQELLDNPPPPNPYMQRLMAMGTSYV